MNIAAIKHETKSRYAYAYDETTLHLKIMVAKNDIKGGYVKAADPFNWFPDESGEYKFDLSSAYNENLQYIGETQSHDVYFCELKNCDSKRIRYSFILEGNDGKTYSYGVKCLDVTSNLDKIDGLYNSLNFPFLNEEDIYTAPSWVKDAIWYQINVGSYSKDGASCKTNTEGNLKGLIHKLDYIQEMGYTALYFTPIFEGASWHNYDTTDYFKIAPYLGTNEDFKEFMEEAHKRGLKVMLDGVFNHCGPLHPFFQDVIKHGKDSKYFDCFYIYDENKPVIKGEVQEDGLYKEEVAKDLNYRTFGYTSWMPKINTGHPLWQEHLLEVGRYWVEEYGIDGWRLDVSNEVSHDFWKTYRKVVKGANPDCYIMGENWDDSYPWLQGDQFDSVMNYSFTNAMWGLLNHKLTNKIPLTVKGYMQSINEMQVMYPSGVNEHMFNLISSHDVDRILNSLDNDVSKVLQAYVLLMTYSGSPCVYYGDEIGMVGKELSNRTPMIWDKENQNTTIQEHVKRLIQLRKTYPALKANNFTWNMTDEDKGILVFTKEGDDAVTVILNVSSSKQNVILPEVMHNQDIIDIYNEKTISVQKGVDVEAQGFYIIKK